jgi:hypothetical protein
MRGRLQWHLILVCGVAVSAFFSMNQLKTYLQAKDHGKLNAALEEEDDQPRNQSIAYVSYGSFNKGQDRFHIMIIDSLRTWLTDGVIYYVLNKEWKTQFEEACEEPRNRQECKRIVPIFVNCPEGYYGPSPCCKMDQGMTVMWENYSHHDWYSYQDDDMYIRPAYMNDFLSGLSPDEPLVLTSKNPRQLGVSWGTKSQNCSTDLDFMYPWGQPAIYSKAGLKLMSKAFQMGAVSKQCQAFGVTHDVGNPIVHWMLGLPQIRLPTIPDLPPKDWTGINAEDHKALQSTHELLGTHGIGRSDTPNATEVHAHIGHVKHPNPPHRYVWHRPNGFLQTTTYRIHGNVSEWTEWYTMNASDCLGPVHPFEI